MRRWIALLAPLVVLPLLAQAPGLSPMDGKATDVALGANGVLWAIGTQPTPGGFTIHRWNGTAWDTIPGGAVRIAADPQGAAWVINDAKAISRWNGAAWETVPGVATDVGIGADGSVWVLDAAGTPQRWSGSAWTPIDGRGSAIAVGPKGSPWVVGVGGEVFRYNLDAKTWTRLAGKAKDVAVASDGTAFMVGSPGGKVFRLDNGQWTALQASAGGERIAAGAKGVLVVARDPASDRGLLAAGKISAAAPFTPPVGPPLAPPPVGTPTAPTPTPPVATPPAATPPAAAPPPPIVVEGKTFTIGSSPPPQPPPPPQTTTPQTGQINIPVPAVIATPIIVLPPMVWSAFPGAASDVGLGANGALWAIGTQVVPGGFTIHRWSGQTWETIPGGAVRIAVSPAGIAWIVNDSGTIFRWTGASWETMPGGASDVGIGADGTVWVIGGGGTPYRWTGSTWTPIGGGGKEIAVGPRGEPWVVNADGYIWRYTMPSGPWEQLPGKGRDIAVSADGTAYVAGEGPGYVHRLIGPNWVADPGATGTRISAGPQGVVIVVKDSGLQVAGMTAPPVAAPAPPPTIALPTGPIVIQGGMNLPVGVNPQAPPSGPSGVSGGSVTGGTLVGAAQPIVPGIDPNAPKLAVLTYDPSPGITPGHLVCSEGAGGMSSICGKVDPLDLGPYRVAVPTDCPAGTFWDGIFGGTCWKCQGDRTTEKVDSPDACVHEKLFEATKVASKAYSWECPAQSFWDGYGGGGCYHCGDGARTAYPIWENRDCSMLEHTPAEFVKNVGCTEHNDWKIGKPRPYTDLVKGKCFACPVMDKDTGDVLIAENTVLTGDQCGVKLRWVPTRVAGKRITASDVTSQLMGSGELVREILADSESVTAYLKFRAEETETPAAEVPAFVETHWADIAANPNEHPIIKAMLLDRALQALQAPASERTPAEQKVLDGFKEYVQRKREAVPGDALSMYYAWKKSVDEQRMSRKTNIGDLLYYGTVPLDFDTAAQAVGSGSALALGTAGVVASFAAFKANVVTQVVAQATKRAVDAPRTFGQAVNLAGSLQQITTKAGTTALRPVAQQAATIAPKAAKEVTEVRNILRAYNGINDSFKAVRNMIRAGAMADDVAKGGEVAAAGVRAAAAGARTAQQAAEIAQGARAAVSGARAAVTGASAAAAGAAVITIVWGIFLDIAIDQVVAIETAEPTLRAKLDAAKQPVSLEAMLASEGGAAELTLLWSSMLEGTNGPEPALASAAAAAAASAKAAGYPAGLTFASVEGKAGDIARGEDGSTWIIGDGGAILRRRAGETTWTTLPGGASRVSVGRGEDAWVVNEGGDVYAWQNGNWTLMCGAGSPCAGLAPAADIAVSSTQAVWAVNRTGDVYRYDATGWFKVPAPVPATRIDAAGTGVAAIVGRDGKAYVLAGDKWADLASPPVADVALDERANLWVVWQNGGLSYLPVGEATWQVVPVQGPFAAAAVGTYPAVTGSAGIRIGDRGYVAPPKQAAPPATPVAAAVPRPEPMTISIPGMPEGEVATIVSIDVARRTVTAKTRAPDMVTVTVTNPGVFSQLRVGQRIWVDGGTGRASIDGETACCPAIFKEGPGIR